MRSAPVLAILLVLLIFSSLAFAASTKAEEIHPPKYAIIKSKIDLQHTGLVWYMQNPNIYYIQYCIEDFNATESYAIRFYTNHHESLIREINLTSRSGTVQLHTKTYADGSYFLNLIQYTSPASDDMRTSKLLDIIRMDVGTPSADADQYTQALSGYIDRSPEHKANTGAAWQNR